MTEEETNGRKLLALEFISMDGVIEAPHEWHFPYVGEDMVQLIGEAQGDFDALLLGRVTYDGFAAAWPNMPDAPGAEQMNGAHHYVVSNTLGTGQRLFEDTAKFPLRVAESRARAARR